MFTVMAGLDDDQHLAEMQIKSVSLQLKREAAVSLAKKTPDKREAI
jgi:hypothetical protein